MTEQEAIKIFKDRLELTDYRKQVPEYYEAMELAVKALEKQIHQDYKWIPVDKKIPETNKYILLSFENFSIPVVGRYEEDDEGGAFYIGDEDETCASQMLFVNAWVELPESYKEEKECENT